MRTRRSVDASPITVTTPSLGVRQWPHEKPAGTRIAWATTGGRGIPTAMILVPVVEEDRGEGPGWWMPRQLETALERGEASLTRRAITHSSINVIVHEPGDEADPAAPRAMTLPRDWPRYGAEHVLVLLVFDESPGGGDPDAVTPQNLAHASEGGPSGQEMDGVLGFLREAGRRFILRGLVRLPPAGAPDRPDRLVFALASCQYPADMTDGSASDHRGTEPPASASLLRLGRLLWDDPASAPSLLVLAGDQVYVDATAGLFDARTRTDRLRLPYQSLLSSPGAQAVFGLLPVAMVIDDHEIVDNWEPGVEVPKPTTLDDAKQAYRRFQRMAGPPLRDGGLWSTFRHAGVPFFLADTRTERRTLDGTPRRIGNWRGARIMGESQWAELREFLTATRDEISFVVSPSMLLPRDLGIGREPSLALEADDWDAFPASRDELFAFLCENDMQRVIFLSGDAHTSCVAHAVVTRDDHCTTLWSVHSSGLYCPYPFANGAEENYASDEAFEFEAAADPGGPVRRYQCVIHTRRWAPGDGFATLHLQGGARGGAATLRVRFHRAADANRGGPGPRPEGDTVIEMPP